MSNSPPPHHRGVRTFRLPPGLGCLLPLIALPIALVALLVAVVRGLWRGRRPATEPIADSAEESALCSLLRKMALDETFTHDEARMAGVPADAGATVDELIELGLSRGWLERRGDRLAVTDTGRAAAERHELRFGID